MTDAVERVARALNPECFDAEVERVYGELWAFDSQAKARRQARAAILSLREPTEDMVDAMNDYDVDAGDHTINVSFDDLRELFRIAIDAALGDPA